MNHKVVIGLGFGDEGKGITTDYLCSQSENPLVVRFSGGQQAAHTVVHNGIRHVFSSFGSGTLRGATTFWSGHCTVDPVNFMNEYHILVNHKGIKPRIFIDQNCPVTTPYDKYYNQHDKKTLGHGTCGLGFGATLAREENHYSLLVHDLRFDSVLKMKLEEIRKYYEEPYDIDIDEQTINDFIEDCKEMISVINDPCDIDDQEYTDTIFEGSQGLLLDKNFGFFPHVTRSNTNTRNIFNSGNIKNIEYYLVTRAYQTRHGNGPMTNTDIPHNIKDNPNETNVNNKYQGQFKKSILDLDLLEYAITKDLNIRLSEKKTLVITCLDHVVDEWKLTYKGCLEQFFSEDDFVECIKKILKVDKVIRVRSDETDKIGKE